MFGFKLAESERAARKLLVHFGCKTKKWSAVARNWRKAKAKLISLLDPKTGRMTLAVAGQPSPAKLRALLGDYGLGPFATALSDGDIDSGRLLPGSALINAGVCGRVRAIEGDKISNCAARALVHSGRSEKVAHDLVAKAISKWKLGAGDGTLVLSANILDILTSSWSCSYSTCHKPKGEYCAGPQQYLADSQTLVAYFYKEVREDEATGRELPHKLWRMMIHVDFKARAAAFMKHYPDVLDDAVFDRVKGMVAKAFGFKQPEWGHPDFEFVVSEQDPAYVDEPTGGYFDSPLCRKAPTVILAPKMPCATCGRRTTAQLWPPDSLSCCVHTNPKLMCDWCGLRGSLPLRQVGYSQFCNACVLSYFVNCVACHSFCSKDDATAFGGAFYCTPCADKTFRWCDECGAPIEKAKAKKFCHRIYCPACLAKEKAGADGHTVLLKDHCYVTTTTTS